MKIIITFGDVVHQTDATYLDGGIKDNEEWQGQW